ncbi:hypothetical protein TrRE_jg4047, partial [Triparma retinervis]
SPSKPSSIEITVPSTVERTLHVEWDPLTGTFRGLPACWADLLPPGTVKSPTTFSDGYNEGGGSSDRNGKLLPVKPTRRIRNSVVMGQGVPK